MTRLIRVEVTKKSWDTVLRLVGLAGVIFETVHEQVDRPYLLALFGGMIGLPSFIRKDEKPHDHERLERGEQHD